MKDQLQTIVDTLKHRRTSLGLSQYYMATKMKIGQNCYSKMELGKSELTLDRLIMVCDLLDLSIEELLFEHWDKLPKPPKKVITKY